MKRRQVGYIGGTLSYGYSLVDKDIQINKQHSKIIKYIFRMKNNGISINKISTILNENNIPSPRGKKWSNKGVTVIINNRDKYEGGLIRSNENGICWSKII